MTDIFRLGTRDLTVEIWTLGARLNGLWFQEIGSLVAGSETVEDALGSTKYNGAVVGPVANRIAHATAGLNGRVYQFEKNEGGITSLHSGTDGVHAQDWHVVAASDDQLTLSLELPDGLGGYPGNRALSAEYRVNDDTLQVVFRAKTDAPTWINLALHPYWCLARNGRDGAVIRVDADTYLPVDSTKIPTGAVAAVDDTIFDLRQPGAPSPEIDHNFCLSGSPGPAISLGGDLGVRMDMTTDAPGVQVYTGKSIGIAIEPQHWPDAMHHPHFPSVLLEPGGEYMQSSTYRFLRV